FQMAGARELAREYGPNPAYWNADVKGFWRTFVPGSSILATSAPVAKTSVMEQAYGAKYYSHVTRKETVEEIARDMFYNRIRSMIGSKYPDAYHTSNSEFRFLASTYGAYRERYAQLFGDTAGKRSDSSWVTDSMIENLIRRGITVEELRNFVWVRTREGGYIPFTEGREAHGLRLSDGDKVVGGQLAVNLGGRWARFDAHAISDRISKDKIALPPDLARMQSEVMRMVNASPSAQEGLYRHKVIDDETRSAMVRFAEGLKAWAGPDKRDVAAYMVHRMCKEAGDSAAMDRTGLLSIRPDRDIEFIGFRKTFQKVWAPFSRGVEQLLTSAFLPQAHDMLHVTMQSEHLRARSAALSARLAAAVHSPETDPSVSTGVFKKDVQEFVDAMSRYRAVWDQAITRDPRGNTFAIGSQANFTAMHHHGPALHPAAISSLDEFQGRTFRKFMEGMRLAPMSVNWMLGAPFILQVRGALTSWYGYPSKHDKSFHPLNPYNMSPVRTLDGMRSLFDPFHSALDLTSGSFRKIAAYALSPFSFILNPGGATTKTLDYLSQKMASPSGRDNDISTRAASAISGFSSVLKPETVFHSQDSFNIPHYARESGIRERLAGHMVLREYGGKAVQDGQVRAHEDQAWIYKNLNVVWNVNTNPGVSYLDFNYNVLADPRLASHLLAGTKYTSYFSHDEYLQKQANMGFVQRHVSAYELTESREEELRHYQSPRQNRMWGFLNPITFFINNPVWPLSYATYESLAHSVPHKFKHMADEAERRKELRFADLHNPPKTFMSGMPVGTNSEEMRYTTLQPHEALAA
ncbi:MAG TPA: hypothetical protein PKJ97_01240, partial [Candidatus Bilamarchaeaceae archaeon]|nr:hypothetical protein [Candidatus Bilamarchaeaceae archaeon]